MSDVYFELTGTHPSQGCIFLLHKLRETRAEDAVWARDLLSRSDHLCWTAMSSACPIHEKYFRVITTFLDCALRTTLGRDELCKLQLLESTA